MRKIYVFVQNTHNKDTVIETSVKNNM